MHQQITYYKINILKNKNIIHNVALELYLRKLRMNFKLSFIYCKSKRHFKIKVGK